MKYFILVTILLISSYIDIKSKDVYLINNLIIFILGLLNINDNLISHLLGLIIPLILLIIYIFDSSLIGLGDIEFLVASSFYLGYKYAIYQIFIASLLGIVYILISKRKEIAFIPFLSIGFIIAEVISLSNSY